MNLPRSGLENMKITEIKTFLMHGGNRNWVFCKVETDEGVHGWGEGTLERHEEAVAAGIKILASRLVAETRLRSKRTGKSCTATGSGAAEW